MSRHAVEHGVLSLIDLVHREENIPVAHVDQATRLQLLRELSRLKRPSRDLAFPFKQVGDSNFYAIVHSDGSVGIKQVANGVRQDLLYTQKGNKERITATAYGGQNENVPFLDSRTLTLTIERGFLSSSRRTLEIWDGYVTTQGGRRMRPPQKISSTPTK